MYSYSKNERTSRRSSLLLLLCLVLSRCTAPPSVPSNTVTRTIRPDYAQGWYVEVLADSSRRMVIMNLESPGAVLSSILLPAKPPERLACQSTTHLSLLAPIGALDRVKGVGFASLVRNAEAVQRITNGQITDLTAGDDISLEVLLSLQPDYFFVYPFGHNGYERYEAAGISCVPVSEYLERHPLGRAEWMVFFGYLTGREAVAQQAFQAVRMRYEATRDSLAVAANASRRPVVFTGSAEGADWFAPAGHSLVATFIHDAGGQYALADSSGTANVRLPFEQLYLLAESTDWWGRITFGSGAPDAPELAAGDERLLKTKAFRSGQLFYCNAATTDYFGDAIAQPEVQLRELGSIFSGGGDGGAVYWKRVGE
jgi:iron complex transport system substrate-binding protein